MAKTKYYAVRKGRKPGIYMTWPECQDQVKGFSGAEYKSFGDPAHAEEYLAGKGQAAEEDAAHPVLEYPLAFTDGSYDPKTGTVGYGGFLYASEDSGEIELSGSTDDPGWTAMRNVAGEVMGCMAAIATAVDRGLKVLHVYHDYTGVAFFTDGTWAPSKPETKKYRDFVLEARRRGLEVTFHWVPGHKGIPGNEKADRIAKRAAGVGKD